MRDIDDSAMHERPLNARTSASRGPCLIRGRMHSQAYCDAVDRRTGRRCQALLFRLPGNWVKVRVLAKGEEAEPGNGVVFCSNPACRAKWEIQQIERAAA